MKQLVAGLLLVIAMSLYASPVDAAAKTIQIKIDGVIVASDAEPELRNNRTMVPLRLISEILGAEVDWLDSEVTITKKGTQIKLKPNSDTVTKNGEALFIDVKLYIKNGRTMVPLRFISETFGCKVGYKSSTVTVDCDAMVIHDTQVKAMQHEYHMTMGGVVR